MLQIHAANDLFFGSGVVYHTIIGGKQFDVTIYCERTSMVENGVIALILRRLISLHRSNEGVFKMIAGVYC